MSGDTLQEAQRAACAKVGAIRTDHTPGRS
jgi:hypothetical protein